MTAYAQSSRFPPVEQADENGLLGWCNDLSVERLLDAYHHGIFPWYSPDQPVLWWSPDPRMVLVPQEFKLSRSLRKTLRQANYQVTLDQDFEGVMKACAAIPRHGQEGTWIHPEMIAAYCRLHELGFAHSVETWVEGQLVGGLYGVALGRMFFGESMFSRQNNASKIALAWLARQLECWGFALIDCQMSTRHLASLGAREISRRDFMIQLTDAVQQPAVSQWQFEVSF